MPATESVIRRMTRLAVQHGAVNLSQGFTDEAPPYPLVWSAIAALLGGTPDGIERLESVTWDGLGGAPDGASGAARLSETLAAARNPRDLFSQYSFPFGLPELRVAIADYTDRWWGYRPDPDGEITVVLGATEGLASVLASLCRPGDGVIVLQPFHEMYPSQAGVFGLRPIYVTLREVDGAWQLDRDELARAAADGARLLVLNTPHNPTGKVFTRDELQLVAELARRHDLLIVTDEIYEHYTYDGRRHHPLATLPDMRERTVVVNSISKTGNATGWRVGWVLAPEAETARIRAVHDTLVVQAPTPLQKAAVALLTMPGSYFASIAERSVAKREALLTALRRVGFRCAAPEGAYYLFADYRGVAALAGKTPTEAAVQLVEQIGVASVPGDNFYATAAGADTTYLRFAFCRALDSLEDAAHRLEALGGEAPV